MRKRLASLYKSFDKWLTTLCGVLAVAQLLSEYGYKGFVLAWVLMHFGSLWRPRLEAWLRKPRTTCPPLPLVEGDE